MMGGSASCWGMMFGSCLLAGLLVATPASDMVTHARALLGVPYDFGGRMRKKGEGIDCQGVLFFAAARVQKCSWKSFSVFPTQSVRDEELGARVPGLDPVATSSLSIDALQPGDVLLIVGYPENP